MAFYLAWLSTIHSKWEEKRKVVIGSCRTRVNYCMYIIILSQICLSSWEKTWIVNSWIPAMATVIALIVFIWPFISAHMCLIKPCVSSEQPGELRLSCQARGKLWEGRSDGSHSPPRPATRPPPRRATNHPPVRFAGNHLCLSCSVRCSHDKIRNSLPLFTHHRPGSTSR